MVGHSHLTYRSFARFDESEFLNDLNNAPFDKVYNHTQWSRRGVSDLVFSVS